MHHRRKLLRGDAVLSHGVMAHLVLCDSDHSGGEIWQAVLLCLVLMENSSAEQSLLLWTPSPRGGLEILPHVCMCQRKPAYFLFNSQRNLCMWVEKKSPNTATICNQTNIFSMAFPRTQIWKKKKTNQLKTMLSLLLPGLLCVLGPRTCPENWVTWLLWQYTSEECHPSPSHSLEIQNLVHI